MIIGFLSALLVLLAAYTLFKNGEKTYTADEVRRVIATPQGQEERSVDMSDYIVTSDMSVILSGKASNGLYYVKGKITNTHDSVSIDKLINMVMHDESGAIVTVRPYKLVLSPGQSVHFEELAGQTVNIAKPTSLILEGF